MSAGDTILFAAMLKQRDRDGALPYDAQREIMAAWRDGRLTLTADLRETEYNRNLRLKPGEPVPTRPIERGRVVICPDVGKFELWNCEQSYAWRTDGVKTLFEYRNISAPRAEFEKLWPPKDRGGSKSYRDESIIEARLLVENGFRGKKETLAKDVEAALKKKGILARREITKSSWKTVLRYIRSVQIPR